MFGKLLSYQAYLKVLLSEAISLEFQKKYWRKISKMDRTGRKVKIILIGNRYYSGLILEETESTITIKDKFGEEVSIGKNALISMEVIK